MTISTVAPATQPAAGTAGSSGSGDAAVGGFFAALLGLSQAGTTPGAAVGEAAGELLGQTVEPPFGQSDRTQAKGTQAEPTEPTEGQPAGTPELSAAQILAAAQVVPVAPMLASAPAVEPPHAQSPEQGAVQAAHQAADQAADQAAAPQTGVQVAAPTGEIPAVEPPPAQSATVEPPLAQPAEPPLAQPAEPPAAARAEGTEPQPAAAAPQPTQVGTGHPGANHPGQDQRGDDRPAPPSARVEATSTTQPAGAPALAPTGPAARTEAASPAAHVTGQVFGEVSRLVSRGDGTRRITIKLSPEALGDVRVVLTVRQGEVHVRMAGSELAQRALQQGAPELHRLLEAVGAGSSQIVVGDHSSTGHDRSTAQQWAEQGGLDAGQENTDHRSAGTRDGEATARDGAPRGTQPRFPTEPPATSGGSTRTRTAGVDVTI
jgi:flagellar hook-length control protein FliK